MEPDNQQKSSGGSKAVIVGAGIVCSILGAALGAFGYHVWTKEEEERKRREANHSHAGPSKTYNHGPCPICLEKMDELITLKCGHQYHKTCTVPLGDNGKCPLCRKEMN